MYLQSFFRWFSQYGSLLSALLGWNTLIELFLASLTFVFWSDACEHAGALRTELAYLVAMRGLSRAVAATLVFLFGLVAPTLYLTQDRRCHKARYDRGKGKAVVAVASFIEMYALVAVIAYSSATQSRAVEHAHRDPDHLFPYYFAWSTVWDYLLLLAFLPFLCVVKVYGF